MRESKWDSNPHRNNRLKLALDHSAIQAIIDNYNTTAGGFEPPRAEPTDFELAP